jgi:DNA-binding NarL/FixJ family response regulator
MMRNVFECTLVRVTIRILIADDHRLIGESLKMVLECEPDMQVVALARDGREALQQAEALRPGVVLMDLAMPGLNGFDATRAIAQRDPACRVVALSTYTAPERVRQALRAGATAYVPKSAGAEEVVTAIRAVNAGQRYLSPRVAEALNDADADEVDPLERLSAREREILQLLAEGCTGAEIAQRLVLSQKTVETYRARLVEKLGIRDLASLVRFAIQRGLVSLD